MERYKKLTLLHSNDMHGDFLAEDRDQKLLGGVARLSGYVNKVRSEEKNVLYCIAGDMFSGSVIDSDFLGLSTIRIMNMLAPDVATVGNHETDYGLTHLLFVEKCAEFPIVNANLYENITGSRLFSPCKVLKVDGMKILFIGILTEEVIKQTKKEGIVGTVVEVADAATEVGKVCNTYRSADIDMTVLLTHIGFEEDKKLAEKLNPAWGVDVIIGGHSHTFLEKPAVVNGIPIVQAGTGTDLIGRFDITIDTRNNSISDYTWQTVPIDSDTCPRDEEIFHLINDYKMQTDEKYGRVITHFCRELTHPSRTQETELGDLFAEALRDSFGLDMMLMASGSLRTPKLGPIVTLGGLTECFPFDDGAYMLSLKGSVLRRMIQHMLRPAVWKGEHCEFYQFSDGLKVSYSVPRAEILEFSLHGKPIEDETVYTVGMQSYHFDNLEAIFNVSREEAECVAGARVIATSCKEVIEEYLENHWQLGHAIDGRMEIIFEG